MTMLYVNGAFITVGLPEEPLPALNAFDLMFNGSMLCAYCNQSSAVCLTFLDI